MMRYIIAVFCFLIFTSVIYGQVMPMGFISSKVEESQEVFVGTYVTIGTQKWLDHNFDLTTYNNGDTDILYIDNAAD